MRFRLIFLPFVLFLLLYSCTEDPAVEWPASVQNIYQPTYDFSEADALRNAQDYERAQSIYQEDLTRVVSPLDSFYAINQMAYCKLIIHRTVGVEKELECLDQFFQKQKDIDLSLLADYFFNKGRYYYLNKESKLALHYTHKALNTFEKSFPKGHLKIAQTLTSLALIHEKEGNLTDSIHHYTLLANNLFLNDPDLKPYDWEMEYVFALGSWFYLAHERGIYHCRVVLEKLKRLPFEDEWLKMRTHHFLANLQKKRADGLVGDHPDSLWQRKVALYELADQNFHRAMDIGQSNGDNRLLDTYVYWIINVSRFEDSTRFFNAMETFEKDLSHDEYWYPHKEYLLGYYYFPIDINKSIQHFSNFVNHNGIDSNIFYLNYAAAFHCLRVGHKVNKAYKPSIQNMLQSYQLYGCLDRDVDLTNPSRIGQIDSTKRYCLVLSGYLVRDLIDKYYDSKDLEDLQLAAAYMDFVDQHSFKSLLHRDEDAFLTYQLEAGTDFYARAIEVSLEFWNRTQESEWMSRAFSYMENLKSFLLHRDMLRKQDAKNLTSSLSDSIRLLQGQVNGMLFDAKANEELSEDFVVQSDLVKQLNSLQFERSKRFKSVDLAIYRNKNNLSEIQKKLGNAKGVVNYFNYKKQLYCTYIDADTAIFYRKKADYDAFEKAILDYRNSLEKEVKLDKQIIQSYLNSGHLLYKTLIEPFSTRLSKIDQLIVIPDDLLDPIPFESLLTQEVPATNFKFSSLPYLLKKTSIVYTSSWKVYTLNQTNIETDFRNNKIGFWTSPDLASVNGLEVIEHSIEKNFGKNYRIFNQEKGGKKLFSKHHSQFDILHLLLHAKSSRVDRYDNQVAFGPAEKERLYGYELYQEKFQSKLIVLASCESATGTPKEGEGTFSLARSFINSGVSEIIAAQYLVPQTTTGQLLSHFYEYLSQENNAASALQLAKLKYLESTKNERHAYPRFWAGMIIMN